MRDWAGKRYWVVGAGDGVGREVALALARLGATVVLSAGPPGARAGAEASGPAGRDAVRAVAAEVGARAEALAPDAAGPGEVDGLACFLDVGSGGAGAGAPAWEAGSALAAMDANYAGALGCVAAVVPSMVARGSGHVVLAGATSALRPGPGDAAHAASKAAVMTLARSLRSELWGKGVAVQLVTLGPPGSIAPEAAAREAVEFMGGDGFAVAVPAGRAWAARAAGILPEWAYQRALGRGAAESTDARGG